jgi:uncharacterized protein (TIGR03000 family)
MLPLAAALLLLLGSALPGQAQPPYPPGGVMPREMPVMLVVILPADAKLLIEDDPTVSTGEVRRFRSPPLVVGKKYTYTLKATWKEKDKEVVDERNVSVEAGREVVVDFRKKPATQEAGEQKVPLDKLPKAVTDALKERFPDAELKSASKEIEEGKTLFEVNVKNKDQNIDVTLTPDGAITGLEKEVEVKDLPKEVREALTTKYPNSTINKAEEVIKVKDKKEELACYEVVLTTAEKKKVEVQFSAEGKILKEEGKDKK